MTSPGAILAGKYRILELIGQGGMGSVWRAERSGWQSQVAIKLIDPSIVKRPEVVARFQREAKMAANLRSPHVVQILDDGVDEATGAPFIVLELLEGETVAERLTRLRRLDPTSTARMVQHVGRALTRAHELGMVHRDLKPENIFLVRNFDEDVCKVLDFGVGRWSVGANGGVATRTGMLIGTPSYMSPEQISGLKTLDYRTDLWSLGVIACECLTGRRPFEGDSLMSLAVQICTAPRPVASSLGTVPPQFDQWFERATARAPADRFQSAAELSEELLRVCSVAPLRLSPQAMLAATDPAGGTLPWNVQGAQRSEESLGPSARTAAELASGSRAGFQRWLGIAALLAGGIAVTAFVRLSFFTGDPAAEPFVSKPRSDPAEAVPAERPAEVRRAEAAAAPAVVSPLAPTQPSGVPVPSSVSDTTREASPAVTSRPPRVRPVPSGPQKHDSPARRARVPSAVAPQNGAAPAQTQWNSAFDSAAQPRVPERAADEAAAKPPKAVWDNAFE